MKAHTPELTILLTCRIDFAARYQNVIACLRYYSINTDAKIMLLEADKEPQLEKTVKAHFPDVKYIFVKDDSEVFHRTHYINEQFRLTETANAACIDVDTIVPIAQLKAANEALLNDGHTMVLPYDGRFLLMSDFRSNLFRQSAQIGAFESDPGNQRLMFGYISVGGAYLCNVKKYKECGWENEHFIGWGPEDYERFLRLEILGRKPLQIPGVIYHLNHPRGGNSGNHFEQVILATKREYCKVCAMMPDELRAYIDSWPWAN